MANPHRALGLYNQQNIAVRGKPATVQRGCDSLATDWWESKLASDIIDHGGVIVRSGDMIVLPTCLHGLDGDLWDDPQAVDFARPRRRTHAAFGTGVHTCPGAPLARSEITILLEEWLTRIPVFSLAEGETPVGLTGAVNALATLKLAWPVAP